MYHHVAITATGYETLQGMRVLDLACGRGGGLAFLAEHFSPEMAIGIDSSSRQINFAIETFKDVHNKSLQFIEADGDCISTVLSAQAQAQSQTEGETKNSQKNQRTVQINKSKPQ